MAGQQHRIVIRRTRRHHEEHHGGSWKIAYADFMTAMMAFFLVMWLLSLVPKSELSEVAEYFRQPLMSAIKGDPNSGSNRNVIPGGSPTPIPNRAAEPERPTPLPRVVPNSDAELRETAQLEDLRQRLETLIATNPRLKEFRPQLVLDMTPEGLRIQIVDGQNRPMFATGSAQMNPDMDVILRELSPTLNMMPNGLSIAGHTDATQYASGERAYSNWELSADRANAARRTLVAGGIAENKVRRVMGLSATMGASADPYEPANRRISIVVLNKRTEDALKATYGSRHVTPPTPPVPTDTAKPEAVSEPAAPAESAPAQKAAGSEDVKKVSR
ncbi:flagellar motor protein MotB [Bordetella sp. 15P40C-2]|uniref:flagellar motor protein MotB n=1 Tax=Bordetella sp. 15P40C-2 TaxID=2572246 RepID=UPI001327C203|nr:flagellar motor protein MotB [Bordetella sp. 15P40C-2]MVW70025.1 flagellar motor protein MotB [Bordetella sp. 15P40C-2]